MGAEANRLSIRYAVEVGAWGSTVANGPASREMRVTGESLGHQKGTEVSRELRQDRQRTALLQVSQSADGGINWEMLYGEGEAHWESLMRSAITSGIVSFTSTTFAASSILGSTSASYAALVAGQSIRIHGTGLSNDGAVAEVVSASAAGFTVRGTTLTAEAGSARINGRTLANGTTKKTLFIEAANTDLNAVKYFTGMGVAGGSLSVTARAIVTGSFTYMGKRGFTASATVASTVVTSAGTNDPMTAAAHVGTIMEANVPVSTAIQGITLSIGNNMRERPQVGSLPSAQHGDGTIDVTGQVNFYFEDINMYSKMINHTDSSLSFRLTDDDDNVIVVSLPALKFSGGDPDSTGENSDVFLPLDFTAFRDAVTGKTIRMDFLPATP